MPDYWHDISCGEKAPEEVNVVVEIPKGSQNKFEYDKKSGAFRLDRVLFSPFHFPGDYGLIPRTLAKDHDPLDALVLVSYPTAVGIILTARPIGVLKFIDNGEEDDKILCVPTRDIRFSQDRDISGIPRPILDEITHFFRVYKELEGKEVSVLGWESKKKAQLIIKESMDEYARHMKKKRTKK